MSDYAVVITARMSSERLPGKALAVYSPDGTPNLIQIVRRWQMSDRYPTIIVATTDGPEDGVIADFCAGYGVPCFRGSRDDVTGRMACAIKAFAPDAKWVARGSADNPLVDVGLADWRLDVLAETGAEGLWYGGEHDRITYAGTTDIWGRAAWDRIASESSGSQCEHAGSYFWDSLSRFRVVQLPLPRREYLAPLRTELDTPRDLEMFKQVCQAWHIADHASATVPTLWALKYLIAHPEVAAVNADVPLKTQTHPVWRKGIEWLCERCARRVAGIVAGDLEVRCAHCGSPRKWYSQKPKPSMLRY